MGVFSSIHAQAPRHQGEHPGEVLLQHGLAAEALPYLIEAARLDPESWGHQVNLSVAYRKLGRYDESRACIIHATQLAPDRWEVFHAWGHLLDEVGEFDNALRARWKALELSGDKRQEPVMAVAWSLLRQGEWKRAWPLWEAGRYMRSWSPPPNMRPWSGEPLEGKRLLVMAEGGYGDTFMFARWLPQLRALADSVTLFVWDAQIDLLKQSPELSGVDFLPMTCGINPAHFDYATSILSLPALVQAAPDTLPPSITFDVTADYKYDRRLGLCWKAEEAGFSRKIRSMPDACAEPFSCIKAEWWSLVPGDHPEWMYPCPSKWLNTAKLIRSLDAVVTVDTAIVHLAGCLRVPTILLLPCHSSWTWGIEGNRPAWYDHQLTLRCAKPDQWDESIREAMRLLQNG